MRHLTITLDPDWAKALRAAGKQAASRTYQGETLNFESPGEFFGRLTERRWEIVRVLQGQGELSVRELARRLHRDVKRVHEDVAILAELGLIDRTQSAGVICPFESVHIDMHLQAEQYAPA